MSWHTPQGIEIIGEWNAAREGILSEEALEFIATLQRAFGPRRAALLDARKARTQRIDAGELPGFLDETRDLREGDWTVAQVPEPLERRTVEITGPVDRKMIINALNSGADVFMADIEDSTSPTWSNCIDGQVNLRDAVRGDIAYDHPAKDKRYTLNERTATLMVRPRGWHLEEVHVLVDGAPVSASLFDFGLYVFHNAKALLDKGLGPYLYLPKLESHHEGELWSDVFDHAEDTLGLERGTIKATVLLEHILLAYEIDELLYALREHIVGINAGRWDYIFSAIKVFKHHDVTFPDRGQITMGVPFMKAYTDLLVKTCHRRGAHAIGGMAAFIPSRDPHINTVAYEKVRQDKQREAAGGFDGTWVAHPGLVDVAREAFASKIEGRPHQKHVTCEDAHVLASDLHDFRIDGGTITEAGLRMNINVGIRYIASWLQGAGAAAINNLMEDAATAEISRSQVWQWIRQGAKTVEGDTMDFALYTRIANEEEALIKQDIGEDAFKTGRYALARDLFEEVATGEDFAPFLTLAAYPHIASV